MYLVQIEAVIYSDSNQYRITSYNVCYTKLLRFIMPLFLQNIRGYTPIQTGLIMLPSAVVMGIMMPISGRIGDKFGAKPLVITGSIITAGATYLLSGINMDTSIEKITLLLVLRSFRNNFV